MTSRIPGFYRLPPDRRLTALEQHRRILDDDMAVYRSAGLTVAEADLMVENVISTFALPCAVAVNFTINGVERVVPMVVEEPSVVAAVSNMAKLSRASGGFHAAADPSVMIGQIQLANVGDPAGCSEKLRSAIPELMEHARTIHPRLSERGGGIRGMEVRQITYDEPGFDIEEMVVLHFFLDCADAMGANMVNTVAERLAPLVERACGERIGMRILSNLADRRLARASVALPSQVLGTSEMDGHAVAERISGAWRFAWADPYRAATHNKGVMNGVDAVALATGNDWRAVEAGAHAWCCRDGQYRPMTRWEHRDGVLYGSLEIPMQLGTVGGPTRVHPTVQSNLRMLGATSARELCAIATAVGLAQNLGALRALATEGIQAGHMRMHARTVAATAGARGEEIGAVTVGLRDGNDFSVENARDILHKLRESD
jgi:hydroxymethylglutaryl-CoA reductase